MPDMRRALGRKQIRTDPCPQCTATKLLIQKFLTDTRYSSPFSVLGPVKYRVALHWLASVIL